MWTAVDTKISKPTITNLKTKTYKQLPFVKYNIVKWPIVGLLPSSIVSRSEENIIQMIYYSDRWHILTQATRSALPFVKKEWLVRSCNRAVGATKGHVYLRKGRWHCLKWLFVPPPSLWLASWLFLQAGWVERSSGKTLQCSYLMGRGTRAKTWLLVFGAAFNTRNNTNGMGLYINCLWIQLMMNGRIPKNMIIIYWTEILSKESNKDERLAWVSSKFTD